MEKESSLDWWRFELYRHIAQFVHNPADHTEARLTALIGEFRRFSDRRRQVRPADEHEYALNFYW